MRVYGFDSDDRVIAGDIEWQDIEPDEVSIHDSEGEILVSHNRPQFRWFANYSLAKAKLIELYQSDIKAAQLQLKYLRASKKTSCKEVI